MKTIHAIDDKKLETYHKAKTIYYQETENAAPIELTSLLNLIQKLTPTERQTKIDDTNEKIEKVNANTNSSIGNTDGKVVVINNQPVTVTHLVPDKHGNKDNTIETMFNRLSKAFNGEKLT
jgi:hypothetical protein